MAEHQQAPAWSPCKVENGILHPCPTLDQALQEDWQSNGLGYLPLYNFKTKEYTRSMAVVHSGNLPETGVVVNFCPFCGADISYHVRGEDAPSERPVKAVAK